MKLARELGQPNVDAMLRSMTAEQWVEWQEDYAIEPWGEERADLQAGIVASTVANFRAFRKDGSPTLKPKDFMPDFGAKQEQSEDEMEAVAMSIHAKVKAENDASSRFD